MKRAEALAQRSDIQARLEQLRARIEQNARYPEGDAPAQDARGLLAEADELTVELTDLIRRINRTNIATALDRDPVSTELV